MNYYVANLFRISEKLLKKNVDRQTLSKNSKCNECQGGAALKTDFFLQVKHININTLKTCYQEVILTYISIQH